jgi:hypothetical protein
MIGNSAATAMNTMLEKYWMCSRSMGRLQRAKPEGAETSLACGGGKLKPARGLLRQAVGFGPGVAGAG